MKNMVKLLTNTMRLLGPGPPCFKVGIILISLVYYLEALLDISKLRTRVLAQKSFQYSNNLHDSTVLATSLNLI